MLNSLRISKALKCCLRRYSVSKRFVLGIETSCDDTGAAVVDENGTVLGECLISQMKIHLLNGGVIPHIAGHLHKKNIETAVSSALQSSGLQMNDLSAIAVTNRPGLRGSLVVGVEYAKMLARKLKKPLIPIHHMEAHALTARISESIPFPFLVLLASGGHCQIALVKDVAEFHLLGTSQHNSPGEVLDKIARRLKLLNLPECSEMSGGQAIDFMAKDGNAYAYNFPHPLTHYRDCNFSFSGFGSYANTIIEDEEKIHDLPADGVIPTVRDFCASLLHGYAVHMMHRVQRAILYCQQESLISQDRGHTLVFSGGVACNNFIRKALHEMCTTLETQFHAPPPKWCTDNGVMIAWNGMERLNVSIGVHASDEDIKLYSDCPLGTDISDNVKNASIKVKVPKLIRG